MVESDPERCAAALRRWLLRGSSLYRSDSSRFSIFAFRLHQFLTRGDTVWASLEPEADRHLEIAKKAAKPGEPDKPLFPLVFCRRCGTAYYRVWVVADDNDSRLLPREDRREQVDDGMREAYLHLSDEAPWPRAAGSELLNRLPDALKETTTSGEERIRSNTRQDVPEPVFVAPSGRIVPEGGGVSAALLHRNFLFCLEPSCGVTYTRTQRSERFKLATLGVDSRSTATTILAVRSLITLQRGQSLSPEARKLLSFTDNRQDASLQAGHFNDFVQVALLRSALYAACRQAGPQGLGHGDLSRCVLDAMKPRFEDYAADPAVRGPARQHTRDALRRVLEYFLYRDLERGWRVTAPNLEDCGLLRFEYEGLAGHDGLLGEATLWETGFSVPGHRGSEASIEVPAELCLATPDVREEIVRTLLDELRRALAVKVDVLDSGKRHDLVEQTKPRLLEDTVWHLADERDLTSARVAWPRPRTRGDRPDFFVSSRGAYGQYVKRRLLECRASDRTLRGVDIDEIIRFLFLALQRYGIVEQVRTASGGDDPGYQLNAGALRWLVGDGQGAPDRIRVLDEGGRPAEVNRYFAECYRGFVDLQCVLEAREHTAQVTSRERQEREERFREGKLPLLSAPRRWSSASISPNSTSSTCATCRRRRPITHSVADAQAAADSPPWCSRTAQGAALMISTSTANPPGWSPERWRRPVSICGTVTWSARTFMPSGWKARIWIWGRP